MPPEVIGLTNTGLVRIRFPLVGGDIHEYEFPVNQTILFSQQLRDAGVAVGTWVASHHTPKDW